MNPLLLVAQAAPEQAPFWVTLVPMALIFLVFYVILFLPARKRQKAHDELLRGIKKGDQVVTSGGLYGEVVKVDDNVVLLKLAENVKVRIARRAIAGLEGSPEAQTQIQTQGDK